MFVFSPLAVATPEQANPILSFAPFFIVLIIMYSFLILPQQKKQKALQKQIDNLKKGDRVYTAGGLIGTVTSIQPDYVVLKVGDNENTKVEVLKSAIAGLRSQGS